MCPKSLIAQFSARNLISCDRIVTLLSGFLQRLREEILIMKKYFVTCREALESKLLLQVRHRTVWLLQFTGGVVKLVTISSALFEVVIGKYSHSLPSRVHHYEL